jgi:hypothetical protein
MFASGAAYLGIALRVSQIDRKLHRFQEVQRLQFVHSFSVDSAVGLFATSYQNADREEALAMERAGLTSSSSLFLMLFGLGGWMVWAPRERPVDPEAGFRAGPLRIAAMPYVDPRGRSGFAFEMRLSF